MWGNPQKKSVTTFSSHIASGSTWIHDKETTHKKLVSALNLVNQAYAADDLKRLKDSDNPWDPVNDIHDRLKKFLNAHSRFNRDSLQAYLNLFTLVPNPPLWNARKGWESSEFSFSKSKSSSLQRPIWLKWRCWDLNYIHCASKGLIFKRRLLTLPLRGPQHGRNFPIFFKVEFHPG